MSLMRVGNWFGGFNEGFLDWLMYCSDWNENYNRGVHGPIYSRTLECSCKGYLPTRNAHLWVITPSDTPVIITYGCDLIGVFLGLATRSSQAHLIIRKPCALLALGPGCLKASFFLLNCKGKDRGFLRGKKTKAKPNTQFDCQKKNF